MDAIVLLKDDHKKVAALFRHFEKADQPDDRRKIADSIIDELTVHAAIEEEAFYPRARSEVNDTDDIVLESEEEHHVMEVLIEEARNMDPEDEHFTAKMTVLKEVVEHHVEEEEQEFFPKVRKALGRKRLQEIGDDLERLKNEHQAAS
jgi:hemerythrin superfamily protein